MSYNRRRLLHQAVEKEVLAAAFDSYATLLGTALRDIPVSPEARNAFWTGPAAERYTGQARQVERELAELREDCMATAVRLRKRAAQLREEAARPPDAP